jgi:hypothetical protein
MACKARANVNLSQRFRLCLRNMKFSTFVGCSLNLSGVRILFQLLIVRRILPKQMFGEFKDLLRFADIEQFCFDIISLVRQFSANKSFNLALWNSGSKYNSTKNISPFKLLNCFNAIYARISKENI